MKTRRGIVIVFGSMAVWGVAAWLLRPHLPDAEMAYFVWLTGTVSTGLLLEALWHVDEPGPTDSEIAMVWAMTGLIALAMMWTPLPAEHDFPRLMSVLPWRFGGVRVIGAMLAAAFAMWTLLAYHVFAGFERRYWLAAGVNSTGLTILDTFFFGHVHPVWPVGLLLALAGFFGPELQWVVRRRPRDVFGSARFEDSQGAARKAGLE